MKSQRQDTSYTVDPKDAEGNMPKAILQLNDAVQALHKRISVIEAEIMELNRIAGIQ